MRVTSDTGGTGVVDGVVLINGGSGMAISTTYTTEFIAGFKINEDGVYRVTSSISFSDSTATAHEIHGTQFVVDANNVISRLTSMTWTRSISSTSIGSSSLAGTERLRDGDFVLYAFENRAAGATDITLDNYSWRIQREA